MNITTMDYTLSGIMEQYKFNEAHRSKIFRSIALKYPDCIVKVDNPRQGRRRKCEIWFRADKYDIVNEYYARKKRSGKTGEYIYGFELLAYPGHYKFGKTNSWKRRRNAYCGHNSVGRVLFVQHVSNSGDIEKRLLQFAGGFMIQEDFGFEWFKTDKTFEEVSEIVTGFVQNL